MKTKKYNMTYVGTTKDDNEKHVHQLTIAEKKRVTQWLREHEGKLLKGRLRA